ncbi:MAG: hypothetical protein JWP58_703 [Hymenobacter sp.]|nr:hypothetical protein [Hymenobacter sp.]
MRMSSFPLVLLGLLALDGCKKAETPAPPPQITLTREGGYWEWISHDSNSRFGYQTPATTGFERQLRFKSDSMVYAYQNNQLVSQAPYRLSHGRVPRCGSQEVYALVHYVTNPVTEPKIWNNDLRIYSIAQTGTEAILTIRGESECVDGGAKERYRWQAD